MYPIAKTASICENAKMPEPLLYAGAYAVRIHHGARNDKPRGARFEPKLNYSDHDVIKWVRYIGRSGLYETRC